MGKKRYIIGWQSNRYKVFTPRRMAWNLLYTIRCIIEF